ncbi:MFS general substrate transporter [Xylaria nigripes]|nr:MFS general substrate transporter [Xylaria nigripes]
MSAPDKCTSSTTAVPSSAAEATLPLVLEKTANQAAQTQSPSAARDGAQTERIISSNSSDTNATPMEAFDEKQYPHTWKLVLLTIALCSALLLVSLDNTILATVIPIITTDFQSLGDVAWYASSYLFAVSALQLFFGKLYAMYSVKWVFLVAIVLFELGSVVAAVSPSSAVLIAGRTISGAGSAGIIGGAIILIAMSVPLRQRPIYTSILSSMHGIASVIGPLLGGAFADHLTWRWCFYINLPFGALTIVLLFLFFPNEPPSQLGIPLKDRLKEFDLPGTLFLVPSVISLLLALQWGGAKYPWGDGRIIALFVIFGVLGIIFWCVEIWQKDSAIIPCRMLRNKNITGGVWYGVWTGIAIFVFTFYLPIWFQAIQGVSATQSGIRNLPSILGLVLFSMIGGGLATVFGQYVPLILVSSVIMAVGSGLLSTLEVNSSIGYWLGYQILMAGGAGLGGPNVMLVAQVAVPQKDMAIATSLLTFSQTLSSAIFLAVAQNIFQNQLFSNLTAHAPEVDAASVISMGATGFRKSVPPDQLPAVLRAYNKAIMQTFYLGVASSALSILGPIFMDWISLKTPEREVIRDSTRHSNVDGQSVENSH